MYYGLLLLSLMFHNILTSIKKNIIVMHFIK
jgi:hypothetical protein